MPPGCFNSASGAAGAAWHGGMSGREDLRVGQLRTEDVLWALDDLILHCVDLPSTDSGPALAAVHANKYQL